jgi:predicted PolB exonuclease-like 3'-5' exonuclease
MSKYLIVDVETFRVRNVPWELPTDNLKAFPPLPCHGVAAIGGLALDISSKGNCCTYIGTFGPIGDESYELSRLETFLKYYRKEQPVIVTFNGRKFDIPVLWMRAMHHGMSVPEFFNYEFTYRFIKQDQTDHFDLSDRMSDFGAAPVGHFDQVSRTIGLPGKVDVDGSMVHGMFDAGEHQKIASYVQCDVIEEALLFLRYLHVRGDISTVVVNNLIHSVRSKATGLNDPMVTKLIGLIDFASLEVRYGQPLAQQQELLDISDEKEDGIPF